MMKHGWVRNEVEAVRRFSSTFSRRRIKYFPTNGVGFGKKTLIGLLFNLEVWEEDYNIEKGYLRRWASWHDSCTFHLLLSVGDNVTCLVQSFHFIVASPNRIYHYFLAERSRYLLMYMRKIQRIRQI